MHSPQAPHLSRTLGFFTPPVTESTATLDAMARTVKNVGFNFFGHDSILEDLLCKVSMRMIEGTGNSVDSVAPDGYFYMEDVISEGTSMVMAETLVNIGVLHMGSRRGHCSTALGIGPKTYRQHGLFGRRQQPSFNSLDRFFGDCSLHLQASKYLSETSCHSSASVDSESRCSGSTHHDRDNLWPYHYTPQQPTTINQPRPTSTLHSHCHTSAILEPFRVTSQT